MSNAKQETIADIVREMRTLGRLDEKSTDKIHRSLQALGLRTYADRIETAAKQSVKDCNHLGNAAAMREILDEANRRLSALMNNHVTFTVDGKEYYQPFLSRDVKEISRILFGNYKKEESK